MEHIHMGGKTSKFAPEDVISNLPDIVINNILDRLSIQDAVRTSILSRIWRFKWTMLSQLVFDWRFLESVWKLDSKVSLAISRILLHLRGPITKVVLPLDYDDEDEDLDDEDINHWISFLSRKGITDITIKFRTTVKLPTHLFSCFELKHLELHCCSFSPPPSFRGFPNLLTLKLNMGFGNNGEYMKLFTRSPLLEMLKLEKIYGEHKVKLAEIAKLKNLKILSLPLCSLDNTEKACWSTIFKLVGSLPKLQELDLNFEFYKLTEDVAKIRLSTDFLCLKALKLSSIRLDDGMQLSCAFKLIGSFPNLQTLEITEAYGRIVEPAPEAAYDTMGSFQLRRVVCWNLNDSDNSICFIKCLLACSPFLKKISIHPMFHVSSDKKLMFATNLLKLPRASSLAEIDLLHF